MSVNKVIIIGNLGRDPELNHTKSGTPVCNLSVATSSKKGGEEVTEWHRVTCWEKTAEHCAKYLSKGRQVYVEGRLQTRKWEKDGQDHYTTEIVAWSVQFLGSKGGSKSDDPEPYDPGAFKPVTGEELPF
jgi:single-strand DNA-binding protein